MVNLCRVRHTGSKFGCLLLLFAGLVAVLPASAEIQLTPHRAEYKVSVSVFGGELSTELRTTDEGYVATHVIRTTGMSRLLASGNITDSASFVASGPGIRPQSFHTNDSLTRDKVKADIVFDWEHDEARGTVNNAAYESSIDKHAFDRVSLQYELMSNLMNGNSTGEYVLFDVDEIKTISVRNIGSRKISVPAGTFVAVGVQHQTEGSKRVTTMWCAEELDFLPVVVEQHRKGKLRMRAELRSYTPLKSRT